MNTEGLGCWNTAKPQGRPVPSAGLVSSAWQCPCVLRPRTRLQFDRSSYQQCDLWGPPVSALGAAVCVTESDHAGPLRLCGWPLVTTPTIGSGQHCWLTVCHTCCHTSCWELSTGCATPLAGDTEVWAWFLLAFPLPGFRCADFHLYSLTVMSCNASVTTAESYGALPARHLSYWWPWQPDTAPVYYLKVT